MEQTNQYNLPGKVNGQVFDTVKLIAEKNLDAKGEEDP